MFSSSEVHVILVVAVFTPVTIYSSYLSKCSVVGPPVGSTVPRQADVADIAVVNSVVSIQSCGFRRHVGFWVDCHVSEGYVVTVVTVAELGADRPGLANFNPQEGHIIR